MPKRPDPQDDARKRPAGAADETREALEFCFEDVSSLRMVGAAPLSDLMAAQGPRRTGPDASSDAGRAGARRGNLLLLVLLVLTMGAVVAATVLR